MPLALRNRYYAVRHGISLANEHGIIISHPDHGVPDWGLSPRGADDCRRRLAPRSLQAHGFSPTDTVVYTSDFRRAVETAAILCELNRLPAAFADSRLRERCFGRLERQPISAYDRVWERDTTDDDHDLDGCESTAKLAARLRRLIDELESLWQGKKIVLVSHGDPLQVLQTILLGLRCNQHRTLPHLENAEVRRIDAA